MTEFSTEDGTGSYEVGLIALPDGRRFGIEEVMRLTPVDESPTPALPDLLNAVRGALSSGDRLPLPLRLALSTVRAGLGAIEQSLGSAGSARMEIVLTDGTTFVARMPPELAAAMQRDRILTLAALARAAPAAEAPSALSAASDQDGTAEALTSIFRYEKRNGRLRRVGTSDKAE